MSDARSRLTEQKRKILDSVAVDLVRDSILSTAAARFLAQIMAEHGEETDRIKRSLTSEITEHIDTIAELQAENTRLREQYADLERTVFGIQVT